MHKFKKEPDLSPEQIKELVNQWFTVEEAIIVLSLNGEKISNSAFNQIAKQVDMNKNFAQLGKPQTKKEKPNGRGRPKKLYNRSFIESMRSLAMSDTYKHIEEYNVDYFINNNWKNEIKDEFREVLKEHSIDLKDAYGIADELSSIVGDLVIQKYNAIIGQNKLLIHQNKKLEDTKEYYISLYRGVEENANILNEITMFIKNDIAESSKALSRKEAHHTSLTMNVESRLDTIENLLEDIKDNK